MSKNLKHKILFFFVVLFYKLSLDYAYIVYVTKVFGYAGFELNITLKNFITSNLLILIILNFVPYEFKKISDWFLNFFYIIALVPLSVLYGLNSKLELKVILINIFTYFVIYLVINIKQFKVLKVKKLSRGEPIFVSLSLIMVLYLIIWYVITGALGSFNLDFSKVYEFREKNAELTNVGIAAYVNNWVYQIFSLAFLGYGYLKKNKNIVIFSVLSQIIFFGVSAHKSVLFSIFMIGGLYYYFKITKHLTIIPVLFLLLIWISLYIAHQDMISIYPSMFIRRFFLVPAQLSFAYYDFFQNNPFDYWAKSILSGFNITHYSESIPQTIGNYVGTGSSANNGFVSSGYSQAGLFGVLLYAFITGITLKFIDYLSLTNNYPLWFSLIIVVNPLKNLIVASDLFTTLLTHGLIISIFLLWLLNSKEEKSNV